MASQDGNVAVRRATCQRQRLVFVWCPRNSVHCKMYIETFEGKRKRERGRVRGWRSGEKKGGGGESKGARKGGGRKTSSKVSVEKERLKESEQVRRKGTNAKRKKGSRKRRKREGKEKERKDEETENEGRREGGTNERRKTAEKQKSAQIRGAT